MAIFYKVRPLRNVMLAATFLLGGCATMTPEECVVARWDDVGLRDGMAGHPLARLENLSKDCAKAGVAVDAQAYLRGRDAGLRTYCQIPNAGRLGLEGRPYEGVCPAALDGEFRRRHTLGLEVYRARQELGSAESRRRSLEKDLAEAKNDADRRKFRDELSQLDHRLHRARDRVRETEFNFDRYR